MRAAFLLVCWLLAAQFTAYAATAPTVSNVTATQQAGTKLVDIYYNLTDPDSTAISISILISSDAGATWNVPAFTFTGHYGGDITPGTGKHAVWNAGADWDGQYDTDCRVRVIANDANPDGFVLIPAGSFQMGDALGDGGSSELPVHTVNVSAFYMEKSLVTGERWKAVVQGAASRGYTFTFDNPGTNKAAFHPVHTINWYDAAKWCNARSQLEGRTPCYYTNAGFTTIYRSGQVTNPYVNWSANGYRLPTEAEWEKAARGGLTGKRFPWGDTITHNQANYNSSASYPYDTSATRGYHPTYMTNGTPYTSPVASFPPNGYGLNDMAGNLHEWCWDWFDAIYYASSPGTDPRGPTGPSSTRVLRGGYWYYVADYARCADRVNAYPDHASYGVGFRCVRGL